MKCERCKKGNLYGIMNACKPKSPNILIGSILGCDNCGKLTLIKFEKERDLDKIVKRELKKFKSKLHKKPEKKERKKKKSFWDKFFGEEKI